MRKPVTLVTGANGEIGHALVQRLAAAGRPVVTIDIAGLESSLAAVVLRSFTGSVTDAGLLERVLAEFEVDLIFHLAALLSTRAEFTPLTAHQVNVDGTLNLLEFAQREGESHGRPVMFVYPSSIAAYGLADLETKTRAGRVAEDAWNTPRTMYGCNKLYCEHLGRYYARYYKQLAAHAVGRVDFRCVRFPGLISAITVPAGGTSDYAPEMIHAAARQEPYACFVRPDTRIPFMAMPDAVDALLTLAARQPGAADPDRLQPVGVQPHGRSRASAGGARVPGVADHLGRGSQAAGDHRLVARGRGRHGSAARLGVRAPLRFRIGVRRLSDSDDQGAVRAMSTRLVLAACLVAAAVACSGPANGRSAGQAPEAPDMNTLAERYVRLVLALGQHDADYVDAYYGPPEWKPSRREAAAWPTSIARPRRWQGQLAATPAAGEELVALRHQYLTRQLEALRARVAMLSGTRLTFDEESKALYDAVAPTRTRQDFERVLGELERRLPGPGPLADR